MVSIADDDQRNALLKSIELFHLVILDALNIFTNLLGIETQFLTVIVFFKSGKYSRGLN